MNGRLEDEKTSWLAFFACFITYTVISMTKNTYSAAIAAIVQEGLFTKADAGVINASFYLFYGVSQFLGGYLADRISPFKIILVGLVGSIATNAAMALSGSFTIMLIAWSINGIAQFGIWPAVVKVISSVVIPEHKKKAMTYIAFAYSIGSAISYLSAVPILNLGRWPNLFWFSVISLVLSGLFLCWSMGKIKAKLVPDTTAPAAAAATEAPAQKTSLVRLMLCSGLVFLLVPALTRCMLDIGLKSWVPTMIMESYSTTPGFATLLTTVLIFVNLTGIFIVNWMYPRRFKNACVALALQFVASLPLLALILLTGKIFLIFIVLSMALVTTFMTAGGQFLNVVIPTAFSSYKKTGMVAGILNAFGCFGCMISTYLYGYTAEHFGWTFTALLWLLLGAVTVIFCLAAAPLWKRFTGKKRL